MITRGLKSSPTPNLEIMARILPIKHRLKYLALKSSLRLKMHGTWNQHFHYTSKGTCKSHTYDSEATLSKIPFTGCKIIDSIPTELVLDRKFKTFLQDRSSAINFVEQVHPGIWQLYTDGSKAGDLTGAGFCVLTNSQERYRASYQLHYRT